MRRSYVFASTLALLLAGLACTLPFAGSPTQPPAPTPFPPTLPAAATVPIVEPAMLHRLWWKQLTVFGSTMGTREDFLGAYELVRTHRARVHVDRVFPLAETRAAHERLERGEQLGKIVLAIPG